jgi:hypothetical protein
MASLVIQKILETRKITEYLTKKHIYPDGPESNGKLKYHCPLHEGDNTPSFYVYLNSGEYENYYCFGCKARFNIIHLYRDLEKVTLGDAIRSLADGLNIDINAELSSAVTELENDTSINNEFSPVELSLLISRQLYEFVQMVEKDPANMELVDKLTQQVDAAVDRGDVKALKQVYEELSDALVRRIRKYLDQKERRMMELNSSVMG